MLHLEVVLLIEMEKNIARVRKSESSSSVVDCVTTETLCILCTTREGSHDSN